MKRAFLFLTLLFSTFVFFSCKFQIPNIPDANEAAQAPADAYIDDSVNPGDDFYKYANGKWMKEYPVTEDIPSNELFTLASAKSAMWFENSRDKLPVYKKLLSLYKNYNNNNETDNAYIKAKLAEIDEIETIDDVLDEIISLYKEGVDLFFKLDSVIVGRKNYPVIKMLDSKESNNGEEDILISPYDFFLSDAMEDRLVTLGLVKENPAASFEDDLYVIPTTGGYFAQEIGIAKEIPIDAHSADVHYFTDRKLSFDQGYDELSELMDASYPVLEGSFIERLLKAYNITADYFIINSTEAAEVYDIFSKLVSEDSYKPYDEINLEHAKNFIKVLFLNAVGNYAVNNEASDSSFDKQIKKVDMDSDDNEFFFNYEYSGMYLRDFDLLEKGTAIKDIYIDLKAALTERIENNTWLTISKQTILDKVDAMKFFSGVPDTWNDNYELKLNDEKTYLEAALSLHKQNNANAARLISETDEEDAFYYIFYSYAPAFAFNAAAVPANNYAMVLPGLLNTFLYDSTQKDAYNYAFIGSVIAHEMTHNFDSDGAYFGIYGGVAPESILSEADEQVFQSKIASLVKYISGLKFGSNKQLNTHAELAKGESVADLGGLLIAYDAFMKKLDTQNLTADAKIAMEKEFFLYYIRMYMGNDTDSFLKDAWDSDEDKTDVHLASPVRGNFCLSHCDRWYELFDITEGEMYVAPEERIRIW